MLSINERDFTQKLHMHDLVIQPYGKRWSVSRWGGTWYDHFEVREVHPCRGLETWQLRESVETVEIWQKKG